MKRRFTILTAALALLAILAIPMGIMGQTTSTYTFTSKSWTATLNGSAANWTSGKDGAGFSNNGIQVTTSATGANGTSPVSYTDVTKIVCTYNTNKSKGAGSIVAKIGDNTETSNSVAYSGSADGTSANFTTEFNYATPQSGNVTLTVNCTTNSIYLVSVAITTAGGTQPTTYTVTYDANGGAGTMTDSNSPYTSGATVTVLANTFTRDNYTFSKWNTADDGSGTDYVAGNTFIINANTTLYAQWTENGGGTGGDGTLTFDFEDDGAHRASGSNSYGNNSYEENGVDIDMTYFDAIQNGAIGGSYLARGRVAKNTTNSPVMIIGPIDITNKTITGVSFKTEGPNTITEAFATSTDGTNYTDHLTFTLTSTSTVEQKTVSNLEITGLELYLKWTGSVSSSTGSNRDFDVDDIVVTYTDASNPAVATTTTISVPSDFNNDLHNGTNAGTLSATVTAEGTAISGASVTWSSSDTGVATVDANGVVTLVAVGTTTITASYAGVEDQYRPSSDTYELTVIDSYAPGTANNPYTVAQAIANTPSNGNVYIQGIVSSFYNTSIVGDGSNYRYRISDDGTTTTELLVYKGKGLNQATFTNANDLLVGDEVVIYGTLNMYNNAPQVASGNYLYAWNRPAVDVEAPTFSPAAGTYTEAQNVTISCATTGASIYYTTDGSEPDGNSTLYDGNAITISSTTTLKAVAYSGGANSTVATATYHINSQDNPYTVTQALAFNEYPANGIYVSGIVSTAPTQNPTNDGELTYYISVDGNATNQLEIYKGKGLEQAAFTSKDDIQVGDIVTIYGNVVIYNNTKEFAQGNYLVSFERPVQQYTLTVTCSANVEIYTFVDPNEQGVEGPTTQQVTSGTEVGISVSATTGYILTLKVDGIDVTSQLDETGYYTFYMPTHDVTVTATAEEYVAPTKYTLYTGALIEGDYLIVYDNAAMNNVVTGERLQYEVVTISDDTIATNNAAIVWHIAQSGDYWTIYNAKANAYAASTGAKNKAQMLADGTNDMALWTVTGTETYEFVNKQNTANSVNANLRKNGTYGFACYATGTGGALSLYKKVEAAPTEYTLNITGYENESNTAGWYLIASPVTVDLTNHAMTTGDFDLYAFDQAKENEWRNFKADDDFTQLEPGKGYLYAHKIGGEFTLSGEKYTGNGTITLSKTDNDNADFQGWNLVGNPFGEDAYIGNKAYYRMENGNEITPATAGTAIAAKEGVFVIATENNESLTFSTTAPDKSASVIMNLTRNRGNVIDRAIVSFGEGSQLPKFQLKDNSTKLCIAKDNNEYAVVRTEAQGEMPVNFRASENGTYTFSVNTENVEMDYLHLIDNMTGADIDLIANPSYSFEAKVTDYTSRFRLVFSANNSVNEQNSKTFAFFNGNDWTINNEGEATLQVVDMNGRVISTETVNGNVTTKVNAATGVYMLRLINGNDVKTQKVVVK